MRIFLTGAGGFIGRGLLPLLKGQETLCLTRNAAALPLRPGLAAVEGSLSAPDAWRSEVRDFAPDTCLHLAWEGLPDYSPDMCQANLDSSTALFGVLADTGVKSVVVAGSCWEYGAVEGRIGESRPPVEPGLFAQTKTALRLRLEALGQNHGFDTRWARIFFSYGPGQRSTSLLPLSHAAYRAGKAPDIRNPYVAQDFVHIDDVARALLAIAQADAGSGIFNIGGGIPASVAEIVNLAAAHFGHPAAYENVEANTGFWADNDKIRRLTGWRPKIALRDGISATLAALDGQVNA